MTHRKRESLKQGHKKNGGYTKERRKRDRLTLRAFGPKGGGPGGGP